MTAGSNPAGGTESISRSEPVSGHRVENRMPLACPSTIRPSGVSKTTDESTPASGWRWCHWFNPPNGASPTRARSLVSDDRLRRVSVRSYSGASSTISVGLAGSTAVIIFVGSQSSVWTWLGPVLGFVGTILLFGASLITLFFTIRAADRRASEERRASDQRASEDRRSSRQDDFLVWWRDKMLRSGEQVVRLGSDAFEKFKIARYDKTIPLHDVMPSMEFSGDTARQIEQHMEIFRLIGAADTATHCEELARAVDSAILKNEAYQGNLDARDKDPRPAVIERMQKNEFVTFHMKIYSATSDVRETVQSHLARTSALDWASDPQAV
jgi:hypothetical protein